jgi:hypothetical protein
MNYADLKFKKDRIAFLREKCASDARWALRALLRIYEDQTAEEQAVGHTRVHNGVGFSGVDGEILSSFAEQFQRKGRLSPKQMAIVFKKMPRYAKQLEAASTVTKEVRAPDLTEQMRDPNEEEGRTVGRSVNPIRHLRDMHRSQCD